MADGALPTPRHSAWSVIAACLICVAAVIGAVCGVRWNHGSHRNWAPDVVARVGTREIRRSELDLAVAQFTLDLRPQMTESDRRAVLDRLIDEELLFEQGMRRRTYESDPVLRLEIVKVMLAMICTLPDSASCESAPARRQLDQYVASLRSTAEISYAPGAPR